MDAGMVQCTEIHQCIPLHNQTQRKKTNGHFIKSWKSFDKIQHPFILKVLEKSGIKGSYLNIVKAVYSKLIGNIKLNREKIEAIPLNSGNRQCCPLSLYLFKIIFEALATAIRQHNEVKGIQIRKE